MAEGTMNAERAKFEAWCDEYWDTSAYLHKSKTCGEWAAWRAAVKECIKECCNVVDAQNYYVYSGDVKRLILERFGVTE